MTIEELNELRYLTEEEKKLRTEIEKIRFCGSSRKAVCAAVGNDPERVNQYRAAIRELEAVLRERFRMVCTRARELRKFLDQVDDPLVRELIELHCIEGRTWEKIATTMQKRGLFYSPNGFSAKCRRYLSKLERKRENERKQ